VMLAQLHGRYPMSVVSARDEHGTMAFLEQYNLVQYFDVIVTGLSAEHTKPYPDPILFAAQKMNVQPQECLMIGDTTVDIRAGRSAGAQTVGVLCGFGEEAELKKFGADAIITDTPQILGLLR
ncbi:MAG TPA: HAD-IA family hydrolase, partial [Anaerolineales bacterium]|nr:HAD-IA family hydrolase [Anaerolineales bacterium]